MFNWLKKSLWLFGGSSTGGSRLSSNVGNGGIRFFTSPSEFLAVDEAGSLAISAMSTCVNLIASNLASLPLSVYKAAGEASVKNTAHPLHWILHDQPNRAIGLTAAGKR